MHGITRRSNYVRPRTLARLFGATVSLGLHLLVFLILWEISAPAVEKMDAGIPGRNGTSNTDGGMAGFIIEESPIASAGDSLALSAADSAIRNQDSEQAIARDLAGLSPVPSGTIAASADDSLVSKGSGDAADGVLYGRYVEQVSARILRAWLRPRRSLGGDLFVCSVSIEQDHHGNVQSITLQRCNGDARWQTSLVQAIESASPLPAPPDPRVFQPTLTLELRSLTFRDEGSQEGFEPARASGQAVVAFEVPRQLRHSQIDGEPAPPEVSSNGFSEVIEQLRKAREPGSSPHVINLTITGTPTGAPMRTSEPVLPAAVKPAEETPRD